jgi:hypothetical protein
VTFSPRNLFLAAARQRERARAFTALERKTRAAGDEEDDTQGDDDTA